MGTFQQNLRIGLALFMAMFGTSALPTASAYALGEMSDEPVVTTTVDTATTPSDPQEAADETATETESSLVDTLIAPSAPALSQQENESRGTSDVTPVVTTDELGPVAEVNVCHSAGKSGNFTQNKISTSSIDELNNPSSANGHGTHANDIIPPFKNLAGQVYHGQNWDTGASIHAANCKTAPVVLKQCKTFPKIEATNQDTKGWTLVRGAEFVDGGVKLTTPGAWTSATISRSMTGTLADLGTDIGYSPDVPYLGLHVKTSEGTLVYETGYGGNWWLSTSTATENMKTNSPHYGTGHGSMYYGTLQEWANAFPTLEVEKLTVLYTNSVQANITVTSVKIGCNEYTFDYVRVPQACSVRDNTYRDTWMFDGYTYPEADDYSGVVNNATFQFTNEGLHISTPDKPSYVFGLIDGGNTPLADVDAMSYKTFRKAISAGVPETLPAYAVLVDTNGRAPGGEEYFIYEPYSNYATAGLEDTWQTWDAFNGGNAKWWTTMTEQQELHTWAHYVSMYPDAVVLAYGFNQGRSNAETYAIIQDMKFDCATTNFAAPQVLGDDDETPTNPVPVTPTVIAPAVAAVLPVQIPATGGGSDTNYTLLGIVLSAAAYYFAYRRQTAKA